MQTQLTSSIPSEISPLGRWLAVVQQLKDTLTIVGLNFLLVIALFFYGLPIPGLVLYFLRWRLASGKGSYHRALVLWCLGAAHELLCMLLFQSADMKGELHDWADWLSFGYTLGLIISLAGFAEALYSGQKAKRSAQ